MNKLYLLLGIFLFIYGDAFTLPEVYQDVFVKGKVIKEGVRSCEDRYNALKPILEKKKQGFSTLNIGASQGYFSFRMAEDFSAFSVMIEGGYENTNEKWDTPYYLKHLCGLNSHLDRFVVLNCRVFGKELKQFNEKEHFDLVLALSVIHHLRKNEEEFSVYKGIIDEILKLGNTVVIENPVNTGDHTQYIRRYLLDKGGKIFYSSKRGTLIYEMFVFENKQQDTSKGIHLDTYYRFNGIWPGRTKISHCLSKLDAFEDENGVIVNGKGLFVK